MLLFEGFSTLEVRACIGVVGSMTRFGEEKLEFTLTHVGYSVGQTFVQAGQVGGEGGDTPDLIVDELVQAGA